MRTSPPPPRLAQLLAGEARPCSACGLGYDPVSARTLADGGEGGNASPPPSTAAAAAAAEAEAGAPATVVCDSCDATYHLHCLRPPLLQVPRAEWFCPECVFPGGRGGGGGGVGGYGAGGVTLSRSPLAGGFGIASRWSAAAVLHQQQHWTRVLPLAALVNGDGGDRGGTAEREGADRSGEKAAVCAGRGGNGEPPLLCGSGKGGSLETGASVGDGGGGLSMGGMGGMGEWGPSAGVPKSLDWSLSRRARECLESEDQARVLHDALRILSRQEGGWLPSPSACWSPGEWVAVLTALVAMVVETHTLNQFFSDAEQRCENLRKQVVSGAKMSTRSFQARGVGFGFLGWWAGRGVTGSACYWGGGGGDGGVELGLWGGG